ncbi:unnamed protein product, partial [Rotaria sordida]
KTTAYLTLYVKVIYTLCYWYELDFRQTYALVGLWNSFFLILYSIFGVSKIMKWSTRSTEEIFALFVSIAFLVDASRHIYKNFSLTYSTVACEQHDEYWEKYEINKSAMMNLTGEFLQKPCLRDSSLLYLLLALGTVWLGTFLYKFKQTPYLTSAKRELLTDYALPVSVIIMSLIGSILFNQINLPSFTMDSGHIFVMVKFKSINIKQIIGTGVLGFSLSLLMFLDQNIAGAIVNSPANKLKKGKAFHVDLFVIAILNGLLSLFGLTWMHGALPLSPLHVKVLADTEERVEQGHIQSVIVKVRETRLTALISHIFIGMSLLMRHVLKGIPMPVLDGLFLYLALTSLDGNQFFERVTLFFTEQILELLTSWNFMIEWLDTPLGQHRATLPSLYVFSQLILFFIYTNQDRLYDYFIQAESKFFSVIFLQCHTLVTALNYLIQWVSMWTLLDNYTTDDCILMLSISIASILAIIVLTGHSHDLVCSPFIISYDSIEYNVRIETSFITEKMNPFLLHLLNYIFYEYIISLLSILAWRGTYKLLDDFLYPNNENMSAIMSLLIGYVLFFIIMYTQFFQNNIDLISTFIQSNYPLFIRNLRHLCAFFSCVFLWRGYWILLDLHIATISFVHESPYTYYIIFIIISFIILSIMKTASSINGPMSHINDEYDLFPLYSNCFLVKWFNGKQKSNELPSNLKNMTDIKPFVITSF